MVVEPKVRIAWSPRGNRAQVRLLECPVFEVFFGGARGGGKTDGVLGEWVACQHLRQECHRPDAPAHPHRIDRDDRAFTRDLRAAEMGLQREGEDVARAQRGAAAVRLSRARRRRRALPGPQLHPGLHRGSRQLPQSCPSPQADGDPALWRRRSSRYASHRETQAGLATNG